MSQEGNDVNDILKLLEQDCTMPRDQLAAAAGKPVEEVDAAIQKLEEDQIDLG